MSDCNAHIGTWKMTDRKREDERVEEGLTIRWENGEWWVVDTFTLTCADNGPHDGHTSEDGEEWYDDTPGAKPHVPEVEVSDAEVDAAMDADGVGNHHAGRARYRRIIAAAKQAEKDAS